MIYTVTLNPAIDYVMYPLSLDMGFTNRSKQEEIHVGGNGINICCLLNELDTPNVALGIAAGSFVLGRVIGMRSYPYILATSST